MKKLLYVCAACAIALSSVAPVSAQIGYYGYSFYSDTPRGAGGASYGYNHAIDEQTMKP